MNPLNYNQPDSRDILSRLIEMFSPAMNKQEENLARGFSAYSYVTDYIYLQNVLNGYERPLSFDKHVIDNATECYKQVNKSLLNFRDLNEGEKIFESSKIDSEATRLKNNWCDKLRQKGIQIIYTQPWQL